MKKIIVTGGLGFIGSNLIELLIKKNFSVINVDKISYSSNFYNVKEFKKNKHTVLGVDPAKLPAKIANKNGINTINKFFDINVKNIIEAKNKKEKLKISFLFSI